MSKKIIFFDIDGTLIESSVGITSPTPKTREIIQKMLSKGHIPIIATGRHLGIIYDDIKNIGFNSFVASAGAHIRINGEVIYDATINEKALENAFKVAKENGIILYAEGQDYCYSFPEAKKEVYKFLIDRCKMTEDQIIIGHDYKNIKANKMFCLWKDVESYKKFEQGIKEDFYCTIMLNNTEKNNDEYSTTDIMMNNISKANGVTKVLELLNIDKKDSYAIGDGLNDLEMFEVVNTSIAMGNGVDKLKKKATFITKSIKDEGIYHAFINMDWLKD